MTKPGDESGVALRDRDIVIIASAPWKMAGRLNCHHIARRLAADNRVLFVESPGLRMPNPLHRADLGKVVRRLRGWADGLFCGPLQVQPNIHVLTPIVMPLHDVPWLDGILGRALGRTCKRAAAALHMENPLLWAFLPTAVHLLGRLGESAVIYHCVDDYAANPRVNAQVVERNERRLALAAELCFATSRPLADRLDGMGATVDCVPNVAEVDRFAAAPPMPAELANLPRPLIGYVGNVAAYKVNLDLVAEIATRRPDWSFVFIGPAGIGDPSTKIGPLRSLPNVHILGSRSYSRTPAYIHAFDVCLIPTRRSRIADGSLPLKTFEYLAAGKPVVSRPAAALVAEKIDGVLTFADNADEFIGAIETCLREDGPDKRQARRDCAARYSWEERFPQIAARAAEMVEAP